ncbi:type IV pilin protein [Candidatus Riflebacteria bacterium]
MLIFRKTFSMIELIVVVAIISILTSIAIPQFQDIILDARVSQLKDNLRKMREVLASFNNNQGRYPYYIQAWNAAGAPASITRGYPDAPSNDEDPLIALDGDPFNELLHGALRPNPLATYGWTSRGPKYIQSKPIDPFTGLATWTFVPNAFYWVRDGMDSISFDPTIHVVAIDVWGSGNEPDGTIDRYDTNTLANGAADSSSPERMAIASDAFSVDWATGSLEWYKTQEASVDGTWFPLTYKNVKCVDSEYSDL